MKSQSAVSPLLIYACVFVFVIYAPSVLMVIFSFNNNIYTTFPLKGFTLNWYDQMIHQGPLLAALWNSVKVGIVVSIVSTIIALLASMSLTRYRFPGKSAITVSSLIPLVIPYIILGISLLQFIRQVLDWKLSLWTIGAGHVLIAVPFSMLVLMSRLEGFDKNLEEASRDLGEDGWHTFWRVTFPLAWPGIVASMMMAFTTSFDEYMISAFLSGNDTTLPIYIYSQLRFPQKLPATLALGAAILVFSFFFVVIAQMLRRRGVQGSAAGSAF
jgi:spermidine/putrescine transport system permease protein